MRFGGTFFICLVALFLGLIVLQGWGLLILGALLIASAIHAYISITDHLEKIEKHLGIYEDTDEETLFERLSKQEQEGSPTFSQRLKEDQQQNTP